MISLLQVNAPCWLDVLDRMGHPWNSWFATPESAILMDEEGCHHTSKYSSGLVRGKSRKTAQYGRSSGGWTSYSNFHPQQQQPQSRHRRASSSSAHCSELLPTRSNRSRWPRRNFSIANRPSSRRRPLALLPPQSTQSSAKIKRPRSRTHNPHNRCCTTRNTQHHTPARRRHTIKAIPSHLRLDLTELVICPGLLFPSVFRGVVLRGGFTEQRLESLRLAGRVVFYVWSSPGKFLLLKTAGIVLVGLVILVVLVVLVVVDFVLRCCVDELCSVDGWRWSKSLR